MKKLLPLLLLLASLPAPAKDELHLYNWNDYIAPEAVKGFEQQCKCKVVQDFYGDNEELVAKLAAGAKGYDVMIPTSNYVAGMARAGWLQPLDHGKIPNFKNLMPQYLNTEFDPGNKYSAPYAMSITLIGYNEQKMKHLGIPRLLERHLPGGQRSPGSQADIPHSSCPAQGRRSAGAGCDGHCQGCPAAGPRAPVHQFHARRQELRRPHQHYRLGQSERRRDEIHQAGNQEQQGGVPGRGISQTSGAAEGYDQQAAAAAEPDLDRNQGEIARDGAAASSAKRRWRGSSPRRSARAIRAAARRRAPPGTGCRQHGPGRRRS